MGIPFGLQFKASYWYLALVPLMLAYWLWKIRLYETGQKIFV